MFLSNPARYFVICTLFLACGSGCGYWQSDAVHSVRLKDDRPPAAPFATREPETYRAEIVITTGGTERRIFTARKGGRSRIDYDYGTPQQRTLVRSGTDQIYSERLNIYTDGGGKGVPTELETDVTANLLAARPDTSYEDLGRENGRRKFRARSGESNAAESIVYVDDGLGLPVRQEFYSVSADGQKVLRYTMELRDAALEADDALFTVPSGARKVTREEFTRLTSQIK